MNAPLSTIYAVVEDADGRLSSPTLQDFTSVSDGRARATTCDGDFNATVPVVVIEPPPEAGDLASMGDLLSEAVAQAVAVDASAQLSSIVALAIDGEGRVNLGDTGNFTPRWIFRFLKSDGRGINVNYLSAAFAGARPQLDRDVADPFDDEVMNAAGDPSALADSTTLMALYESLGCGLYTGSDSESLVITRSGVRDQAIMSAEGGQSLIVDAATLDVIVGCD